MVVFVVNACGAAKLGKDKDCCNVAMLQMLQVVFKFLNIYIIKIITLITDVSIIIFIYIGKTVQQNSCCMQHCNICNIATFCEEFKHL